MEYIVSRHDLPETKEDIENGTWFNLWSKRHWPYHEIVKGDIVYWYEAKNKRLIWKTKIAARDQFTFGKQEKALNRIESNFGNFDRRQPYVLQAPNRGFCLAWKVKVIDKVNIPKPVNFRFPQLGWLKITSEVGIDWFQKEMKDNVTLDDINSSKNLKDALHSINKEMSEISAERRKSIISNTIRKDTKMIKRLKRFYDYKCQFPGCGTRIMKRNGDYYIEVAH